MRPEQDDNWGECYLDHFERLFRSPVDRRVFSGEPDEPTIQILAYDAVFPGCRVFASLGLSHYQEEVGKVAEILVPIDDGWEQAPSVIANILFHSIREGLEIGWGFAVSGIRAVVPDFSNTFGKDALYLAQPFDLPDGSASVSCMGSHGALYVGLFISSAEYRFFLEHGAEEFEDALQVRDIDPYHLSRESAL